MIPVWRNPIGPPRRLNCESRVQNAILRYSRFGNLRYASAVSARHLSIPGDVAMQGLRSAVPPGLSVDACEPGVETPG